MRLQGGRDAMDLHFLFLSASSEVPTLHTCRKLSHHVRDYNAPSLSLFNNSILTCTVPTTNWWLIILFIQLVQSLNLLRILETTYQFGLALLTISLSTDNRCFWVLNSRLYYINQHKMSVHKPQRPPYMGAVTIAQYYILGYTRA